jgi:multidrug efflux system membrane fusion protein
VTERAAADALPADAMPMRRGRRFLATMVVVLVVVNIGLIWALAFYARDEWQAMQAGSGEGHEGGDDDDDHLQSPSRAADDHGEPVVWVPVAAQQASGIVTAPLAPGDGRGAQTAWATVLDAQPLIEARARQQAATAEARAAEAAVSRSTGELRRLRALHADNRNVSASAVEAAQAQLRAEEARVEQARTASTAVGEAVRAQWGDAIADGFRDAGSDSLVARLLRRERVLLQVLLPASLKADAVPGQVRLGGDASATRVGPAVRGDPQFGGATHLFAAPAGNLRGGTRIRVTYAVGGDGDRGVVVPHEAVVWHAGKAWAYVIAGEGERGTRFARRWVDTRDEVAGGWVNRERFDAGDRTAVEGAQLLLSEELRYQVRTDD